MENVVFSIYPGNREEYKVLELAYEAGSNLIMQGMCDFPLTVTEGRIIENRHIQSSFPGLSISAYELTKYIKDKGNIFYTKKDWSEFLKDKTFSFGNRFHGNMMAFLNGIPALWIRHDARTAEMIEAMKLPWISPEELLKMKSLEELIEKCSYSALFEREYIKMSEGYIKFLEENGVEHTFKKYSNVLEK